MINIFRVDSTTYRKHKFTTLKLAGPIALQPNGAIVRRGRNDGLRPVLI